MIYKHALESHGFGRGFAYFFMFSIGMAFIAGGAVIVSPLAAGSGIPEVKAFSLMSIYLTFLTMYTY